MSPLRGGVKAVVLTILFGACFTASADPADAAIAVPILGGHLLGLVSVGVLLAICRERIKVKLLLFLSAMLSLVLTLAVLPGDEKLWTWSLWRLVLTGAATPLLVAGVGLYLIFRSRRKPING